uniref:poly [ADP-ribose] polymerase 2 n=1 Tax=Ciona intestinalis TaxID=7719 RepID=UPI000180C414|nr:poly [ADP-ribose] polymerase 2 [Ciona intestinalis]|eukprot:XP_002128307.1 poly [ADP-ribose] polymerase 2 [Ciona intestinalis]
MSTRTTRRSARRSKVLTVKADPDNGKVTPSATNATVASKRKNVAVVKTTALKTKKIKKEVKVVTNDQVVTKVIKFKGKVPVDDYCVECKDGYHVFVCGDTVYNAMLNQTNIGQNNNKYYLLQVLKSNIGAEFCVWFRWGRVGKVAGTNLQKVTCEKAVQLFEKKFKDKTSNFWENRGHFEKVHGKYDLLEMDFGNEDKETAKPNVDAKKIKSKLNNRVKEVMELIFNMNEFEESVKEMKFDVKKAPLGKLTEKQIKSGYESLKYIEECLQRNKAGRDLVEACSEFYTRIPHDFGMKCPPLVRSVHELKEKLELLSALSDIQIAIKIMDEAEGSGLKENPFDLRYKSLQCEMKPLPKTSKNFKLVQEYVKNTHAATHMNYELSIEDVFTLAKENDKNFTKDIGNRVLLWHGSRLTNWCGILKNGLRIAPPEAPVTGHMFGKGIYFADMVSKSANYCYATHRQPKAFLLLCEVALGESNNLLQADYNANKLPKGKHSVKGLGKTQPDPSKSKYTDDGVLVPCGLPVSEEGSKNSALLYNEFVVYSAKQVRPRFLVKLNFNFTQSW